jgi:hypothetical protein
VVFLVVVGNVRAIYARGSAVSNASSARLEVILAKGVRTVTLAQVARSIALVGEGGGGLSLVSHGYEVARRQQAKYTAQRDS